jgi:AmmeMemoRadiSam system protein A
MMLASQDKRTLLSLARQAIMEQLNPSGWLDSEEINSSEALRTHCGVFVSLYVDNKLRGCIGTFSEEEELTGTVEKMAISAATSDTRFSPITSEEAKQMKIEISVLSPKEKINDIDQIELGKHGIFIQSGMNRGTFLPHVATQQQWTVKEFLGNCSKHKAGLGWEGWKEADIYIYETLNFDSDSF